MDRRRLLTSESFASSPSSSNMYFGVMSGLPSPPSVLMPSKLTPSAPPLPGKDGTQNISQISPIRQGSGDSPFSLPAPPPLPANSSRGHTQSSLLKAKDPLVKHRAPRSRSVELKPAAVPVKPAVAASNVKASDPSRMKTSVARVSVDITYGRDYPKLSAMSAELSGSKAELARLQALLQDTNGMLGGVRSRLAAETNTEAGLHSQAQALTDMAQSLLSHVEAVQASAAENPDGPGLSPNIGALKSQVSFATDALSQLSSQILSQYSQPGSLDALNDTLAFAVKQGIPAAGGLQSFIDSKLKSILTADPSAGSSAAPKSSSAVLASSNISTAAASARRPRASSVDTGIKQEQPRPVKAPSRPPPPPPIIATAPPQQPLTNPAVASLARPVTPPDTPPAGSLAVQRSSLFGSAIPGSPTVRSLLSGTARPKEDPTVPPQQQSAPRPNFDEYSDTDEEAEPTNHLDTSKGWREIARARKAVAEDEKAQPAVRRGRAQQPAPKGPISVPALCPECEGKPPTRRCHECADYLCDECFVTIHRKGARQSHLWTPISPSKEKQAVSAAKAAVASLGLKPRSSSVEPAPQKSVAPALDPLAVFRLLNKGKDPQPAGKLFSTSGEKPSKPHPKASAAPPTTNADLIRVSGSGTDLSGALSELEYRANPGTLRRQARASSAERLPPSSSPALPSPSAYLLSFPSPSPPPPPSVRFSVPRRTSISNGSIGGPGSVAESTGYSISSLPLSATKPPAAHLRLSPSGALVPAMGRQETAETMAVLAETNALGDSHTTEAKIRQRAVLMRQQSAAVKHVAQRSDWHTASALATGVSATLFRAKLA